MPRQTRNILTATKVRNLIRAGKPVAVSDGGGLTLTISQTGHASWVLRYRIGGKRKEVTIGPEADYPLAEARETAETLRRRVAASEDVGATKQHQRASDAAGEHPETFAELAKVWFKRTQAERLMHPDVVWRVFRNWINPRLGGMALTDIRGFHIVECLEAIKDGGAPTVMNDARRYIRSVFAYGVSLGYLAADVSAAITHRQAGVTERSRDRALSLDEIDRLLTCMKAERDWFGRDNELSVRLLLLLGVRKSELLTARWSEFDLTVGLWELPKSRSKTSRGIVIPLPTLAVEYLRELKIRASGSEWVLPARRRGKRGLGHVGPDTVNAALSNLPHGLEDLIVHDLRRTMRTQLSALGVRPEIAERCLNHKLRGVLGVYDQHEFLLERREALSRWASVLDALDREGLEATAELYSIGDVVPLRSVV